MDLETVRAKMMAHVEQARASALARAFGWKLDVTTDLTCYVGMRHRRRPEFIFLLRVTFEEFPRRAPSYVFVDCTTLQMSPGAWPPGVKHNDNPPGICTLGTRECHEVYHPHDAQYRWDSERHTFLSTLCEIQRLMEKGIGG